MRQNTGGCGCDDNSNISGIGDQQCPQPEPCDIINSKTAFCEAENFLTEPTIEETVVLGDVLIQTLTEADIELPDFARDIKHIRKNVRLTQCKALPVVGNPNAVKLFIEGFVHKNIQYVQDCSGVVMDHSVEVPFRCFQKVNLTNPLVFPFGEFSVKNNILERRELAADGHGADRCNFGSLTFEINNEPVKCKLLASAVNQWDILKDFDNFGRFRTITEKMEVILVIKLTQKQQEPGVPIPSLPPNGDNGDDNGILGARRSSSTSIFDVFRGIIGG